MRYRLLLSVLVALLLALPGVPARAEPAAPGGLAAALYAVAVAAPAPVRGVRPWLDQEPAEGRLERLGYIADGIALAAEGPEGDGWPWDSRSLGAAALAVSWHESGRWLRAVHDGTLKGDGGRSHSIFGLMRGPWLEGWPELVGVDREATARSAAAGVRVLVLFAGCARGNKRPTRAALARVLYGYGTGKCSKGQPASWAAGRATTYWSFLGRLPRVPRAPSVAAFPLLAP